MSSRPSELDARRLRGRAVFLSASVPRPDAADRYQRIENAHVEIEEAVISLARAVFSEGGTLVFGGHPAISPLVAMVAGEYFTPRPAERAAAEGEASSLIEIYQSEAFRDVLPDETLMMFRVGYARLHWTEVVDGEKYDPSAPRDRPFCPKSLELMREKMISETRPVAMVAIGGMEGVEEEFRIFRQLQPGASVYTLETTGGAAALLAEREDQALRVIDREILADLRELPRGEEPSLAIYREERPPLPYPLIIQFLVREIIGWKKERPWQTTG